MPVGALSLATSVALGNPFSGPNPQGGNLTWSGFSNGSVAASISGNNGASYENVLAGQFVGFFDPNSEADAPGAEADDFLRFFCIDISQSAAGGPLPYTRTLGVPDATRAAQLTRLFDQQSQELDLGRRLALVQAIQRRLGEASLRPTLAWRLDYFARWPHVKGLTPHHSIYGWGRLQDVWLER